VVVLVVAIGGTVTMLVLRDWVFAGVSALAVVSISDLLAQQLGIRNPLRGLLSPRAALPRLLVNAVFLVVLAPLLVLQSGNAPLVAAATGVFLGLNLLYFWWEKRRSQQKPARLSPPSHGRSPRP